MSSRAVRTALACTAVVAAHQALLPAQDRTEALTLRAPSSAVGDRFGSLVATDGPLCVVIGQESGVTNHVRGFVLDPLTGQHLATLSANDQGQGDRLGFAGNGAFSVAFDQGLAAVCGEFNGPGAASVEAVYVFDATTGAQLRRLVASDNQGSAPGVLGDFFGTGVAISGSLALVGAPFDDDVAFGSGSAYLFDLTTGAQVRKFVASDGASSDQFGTRVALDGTTAVITARFDDDNGTSSGSAYVFDLATGQQSLKLLPANGTAQDVFGSSCDVHGQLAIVGAPNHDGGGVSNAGAAYVFDVATGQELYQLVSSQPIPGGLFGSQVSIRGSFAAVAAFGERVQGTESGAAYVFDLSNGALVARLVPSSPGTWMDFGQVSLGAGGLLLVGAPGSAAFEHAGAVHVYDVGAAANAGFAYCFGDGTGHACPCGVPGAPGEGCANSGGSGVRLQAQGLASLSNDTLGLHASGLPTPGIGLVARAPHSLPSPFGVQLGNGLFCIGSLIADRSHVLQSSSGTLQFTHFNGATFGAGRSPGDVDHYQLWYRDAQSSCNWSPDFNFSNAWWVTWKL